MEHLEPIQRELAPAIRRALGRGVPLGVIAAECEVSPRAVDRWLKPEYAPHPATCQMLVPLIDAIDP
jgi:hypothetical protein